jgi:hypothetical protein
VTTVYEAYQNHSPPRWVRPVPYLTKWVSLNFVGVSPSPSALVGELWEAHQNVTQGWFAFDAFLNRGLGITKLLASTSGSLAGGPRPFLEEYAAVLERHDRMRAGLIAEHDPLEWRQGIWRPDQGDLHALVLGDSYIIGCDWTDARRMYSHRGPLGQ